VDFVKRNGGEESFGLIRISDFFLLKRSFGISKEEVRRLMGLSYDADFCRSG